MEFFILAALSACLMFFLVMACVQLITFEKKVVDSVHLAENKVKKLYEAGYIP